MFVFQLPGGPEAVLPAPSAAGEDLCGEELRERRRSPQQAGEVPSHGGGGGINRPGGGSAPAAEEQRGAELQGEGPGLVEEVEERRQRRGEGSAEQHGFSWRF